MANGYWEVTRLEAVKAVAADRFDFFATLEGPRGAFRIQVPPDGLLSYGVFQRHVLVTLGVLYRHGLCEGRPAEAADERWRQDVHVSLQWPELPPPPVDGAPMN